jgi:hypothetical protein
MHPADRSGCSTLHGQGVRLLTVPASICRVSCLSGAAMSKAAACEFSQVRHYAVVTEVNRCGTAFNKLPAPQGNSLMPVM